MKFEIFKKSIWTVLGIIFVFYIFSCSLAFAEKWYATNAYKSANNNYLLLLTISESKEECESVSKFKSQDIGNKWKFEECKCLSGKDYDARYSAVLSDRPIAEPYISYSDKGGYKTILKFMDTDLPSAQIMISAWESDLKKFGLKDVKVVNPNSSSEKQQETKPQA